MTPTTTISIQPWMSDPATRAVMAPFLLPEDELPVALFVGGCVRDTILAREVRDVDIATSLSPREVMRRLDAAEIGYHTIGADHGTIGAHADGRTFEITTLRVDVETDGRHARVAYTDDWAADAARRDFTMNALYADQNGNIYDPLGGMDDLTARRVRFIGDPNDRIREDALRILRFFRFHAQLEVQDFDPAGLAACRMQFDMIATLSGERIREELFKLLVAPGALGVIGDPECADFVERVLPELPDLTATFGFSYIAEVEQKIGQADPLRRLVALIDFDQIMFQTSFDVRSAAESLVTRLRLSGDQRARLERMIARPRGLAPDGVSLSPGHTRGRSKQAILYELGPDAWRDAVVLNWALHLNTVMETSIDGVRLPAVADSQWLALLAFPDHWAVPEFPLRGRDVLELGIHQGPEISRILKDLEAWWIAGGFDADRDTCLTELARRVSG
jgi:poly(A) polymerase